jgi:methylated-DNA-protein-cysteine methyltransferase-like protein
MNDQDARPLVFESLTQIPRGKVSTYKAVAQAAGINARQVGRLLHSNTNPEVYPCHRVVHADGSMAGGFAFGGPDKQQQFLEEEGVVFKEKRVVLGSHFFENFLGRKVQK